MIHLSFAACNSNQFACNNGHCEPENYVCDGDNDCGDNSDEDGCGKCIHVHVQSASTILFPCSTHPWIDTAFIFVIKLALSFSGCGSGQFTCDNGNCEPEYDRCDGYDDCGDNSDEEGCGMHFMLPSHIA